jgi:hypothetical protein
MIYTCYEMVRDCRADRPEGWAYLIAQYVPVIRRFLTHYAPEHPGLFEGVLTSLRKPESSLFQSIEPAPERWFVAELRQAVLAQIPVKPAEIDLDLETVAAAFEPLTVLEKQVAWIETMRYDAAATGAMLRMAPATVTKIRERSADLIRGKVDTWNRTLLADNGLALGRAAAEAVTPDCLKVKVFLDVLEGRMNWRGREEMEFHVNTYWHCVDHFCRMAEVIEVLRGMQPLGEEEAGPLRKMLGVEKPKQPAWKKLFGSK